MTADHRTGLPFAPVAVPALTIHDGGAVAHHPRAELDQRIGEFASRLRGLGIVPRTLLAMATPDPVDQVVGFLGAIAAGVVPCLLPPDDASGEAARWVGQALVLSGPDLASATIAGQDRIVDDALYVQRTSGTERPATGVVISRAVATASVRSTSRRISAGGAYVTVGWLPLHHDYGLMSQLLLPMALGGTVHLISRLDWLRDPALLFEVVSGVGGTHTYMPAFGFRRCLDKVGPGATYDLSSWRVLNCAGDTVPPDLLPAFEDRCRPWGLRPGAVTVAYGMAEVVAAATIGTIGEGYRIDTVVDSVLTGDGRAVAAPRGRRFVGCGTAMECVECTVIDPDGAPVLERTVGEIAVRGAALGRRLTPTASEPLPTTDGWFRTGDLGYLAGGEIHVVDRIKDLLIVAGVNIDPSGVEDRAREAAPGVRRAAAFMAVLDPTTTTEQPVLLLERPRISLDEVKALRAVRRALLVDGLSAGRVRFVDRGTIAVTTSGKVRRRVTRDGYLAAIADAPDGAGSGPDWLDVIADITGIDRLDERDTLQDLGIDSLALVELLTGLETALDVTIDDRALTSRTTVADLGLLVGQSPDGTWPRPVAGSEPVAPTRRPNERLRAQLRRGPVVGPVHLPLRLGTPVHRRVAVLRLRTSGGPVRAVREVVGLAETIGPCDADAIARISVIANSWEPWRWRAIVPELRRTTARDRAGASARRPVLRVLGASHLADAVATGRGVVVVAPHVRLAPILPALPHLDGRPVRTLHARDTTTVDRTRQLRSAHRALRAGGAVVILADEFIGHGGITIDIAGKARPLRPGFARLALATGSEVIPVFPSFDARGHVTIDVREPMGAATEHDLLVDFGAMLRSFWHEHTGSLSWNIVRRHLNHPA